MLHNNNYNTIQVLTNNILITHKITKIMMLIMCIIDVNECDTDAANDCSENGRCFNIPGMYACECKNGYVGDGFECRGVLFNVVVLMCSIV